MNSNFFVEDEKPCISRKILCPKMTLQIILFPSKISYNLRTGLAEGDFKLGWIQKNKHGVGVVNMEKM